MQYRYPKSYEHRKAEIERRLRELIVDYRRLMQFIPQIPDQIGEPFSGPLDPVQFQFFPEVNTGGTNTGGTPNTGGSLSYPWWDGTAGGSGGGCLYDGCFSIEFTNAVECPAGTDGVITVIEAGTTLYFSRVTGFGNPGNLWTIYDTTTTTRISNGWIVIDFNSCTANLFFEVFESRTGLYEPTGATYKGDFDPFAGSGFLLDIVTPACTWPNQLTVVPFTCPSGV